MSTQRDKKSPLTDRELYWQICDAAVKAPIIVTENPLIGHSARGYFGVRIGEVKKILDAAGKYPAYQVNILNRIIRTNGLWTEKFYDEGRADAHVFVSTGYLMDMFPEYADRINAVQKFNQAQTGGKWARPIDHLDEYIVTSQYAPFYPGEEFPYCKMDDDSVEMPQEFYSITAPAEEVTA